MRNINNKIEQEAHALNEAKRNLWDGACIEECQDGKCEGGRGVKLFCPRSSPKVKGKICVIKKGGALEH